MSQSIRTAIGAAFALLALAGAALAGPAPGRAPAPAPSPFRFERTNADFASFADWRRAFRAKAIGEGIAARVFDDAFAGVRVNRDVIRLDRRQPEFSRPIWDYLDSAVSDSRIETGRAKLAEKAGTLAAIEAAYGVDRRIVLAIWGLESAYGFNYGSIPVVESLATLAYEGRRRAFAEEQLLTALRILQNGDVTPAAMVGSWAGAMGHTQFIPTSFQQYAVDFNGDGRRDVWGADAVDALASTAAYLGRFGWVKGAPWGVEASLPAIFDYSLADQSIRRPVANWRALGVTRADGRPLPDFGEAAIVLPAGAKGPAFAVFRNFRVIKRYNNSTAYALAAGMLGDRIEGAGPIHAAWPRGDRPLSRTEKSEMQRLLSRLGHDTGGVDGIIGPMSRTAIRGFQRASGQTPDGYASARFLARLRAAAGG